jgi:hypothetical protein
MNAFLRAQEELRTNGVISDETRDSLSHEDLLRAIEQATYE